MPITLNIVHLYSPIGRASTVYIIHVYVWSSHVLTCTFVWLPSFRMYIHVYQILVCIAKFVFFNFYCEALVWVAIGIVCGLGVCKVCYEICCVSPRRGNFFPALFLDGVQ